MCVAEISFDDVWQLGLEFRLTFMLQFFPWIDCAWHRIYFSHTRGFSSRITRALEISFLLDFVRLTFSILIYLTGFKVIVHSVLSK